MGQEEEEEEEEEEEVCVKPGQLVAVHQVLGVAEVWQWVSVVAQVGQIVSMVVGTFHHGVQKRVLAIGRWVGPACVYLVPGHGLSSEQRAVLTNALVTGVQQLSEGCSGSFSFNCLCSFLVLSQFTQHTCCHTLDVLHWRIQQLETVTSREKD
ncbi:hypothetical protein EYF80_004067 [Liparis tanakae]|uniref:Uncharacterized protein n=1 Tax=Liparis tanakae TaxID=230148 RepID=A0A4Z2J6Q0_9TELE|nr:hypothetical protein EYF80_004067 [Liparis tanakae]